MKHVKLYEEFALNETINTQVRSKIVVLLKSEGIEYVEDYTFGGGEFIAKDMETAEAIADACAGKFKVAIYDHRKTKDGGIPMMIVQ